LPDHYSDSTLSAAQTPPTGLAPRLMSASYRLLVPAGLVLAAPWFLFRAVRDGKYIRGLDQRLGRLPPRLAADHRESIWIHAVSVGEVLTARALIPPLRERFPQLRLVLSTTTATGQHLARTRVTGLDGVFYFPLDLRFAVRRTMKAVRPRLLILMENEIWPALLHECRGRQVKAVLVNGRISPRSYSRYRLIRPFLRTVLPALDRCCMQSEESARRLIDLGAPRERVTITGNLKFDAVDRHGVDEAAGNVLRCLRPGEGRPVLLAASTLRGEEDAVLRAFGRLKADEPRALLIVAPRHPERFSEVERLFADRGLHVVRRTELAVDAEPEADAVVLDTIGELARVFEVASIVFVGGSLVPAGGHNILEPAVHGKPILFGPSMHNFAEIAASFLRAGAACQVRSAGELEEMVQALGRDPVRRAELGGAARALVLANRGAVEKTLAVIDELMADEPGRTSHGDRALA
jgi:3-deoxy-D-manno-octulosonic-acid transferase